MRKVSHTFFDLFDKLGNRYFSHRITITNVMNWLFASLKLILFMHNFACYWILIAVMKLRRNQEAVNFTDPDRHFWVYVESWYTMTATISTVGYGDFKAYVNSDPLWEIEMIFLIFVTTAGVILFSSITNEIFNYQHMNELNKILRQESTKMEIFMYEISLRISWKVLDKNMISTCI